MTTGRPGLRTVLANWGLPALVQWPHNLALEGHGNQVALVVLVFHLTGSGLNVTGVVIAGILSGWAPAYRTIAPAGSGSARSRRPVC